MLDGDVAYGHVFDVRPVDALDRDSAAFLGEHQARGIRAGPRRAVDPAIPHLDAADVPARLGPDLEPVRRTVHAAVPNGDVLAGSGAPQDEAALQDDGVVVRFDVALRDPHPATGVRVDAVGEGVADGDVLDDDAVAAAEADAVVRRVPDRKPGYLDIAATTQRDRLRAEASVALHVDRAVPRDDDPAPPVAHEESVAEVVGLEVGVGHIRKPLARKEVGRPRARQQRCAPLDDEPDATPQLDAAGEIRTLPEHNRAARLRSRVDRPLDGLGVETLPVAPRAVVADVDDGAPPTHRNRRQHRTRRDEEAPARRLPGHASCYHRLRSPLRA